MRKAGYAARMEEEDEYTFLVVKYRGNMPCRRHKDRRRMA
jgi:hypothetical protein